MKSSIANSTRANPTRIKVCGITRPEDGVAAAAAGVDAIGLVFAPRSPRYISMKQAHRIINELPPFVTVVALFLDPERSFVEGILDQLTLDVLQFHGEESPEFCASFKRPWIKALAMGDESHDTEWLLHQVARYDAARAVLVDSHQTGQDGGTGKVFNWHNVSAGLSRPLVLAGGLHPENVADAISVARPAAVDLSSGVETSPGIKDANKMKALVAAVRAADAEQNL